MDVDLLYDKSLQLAKTIYQNAEKVNLVSRQRAPFAEAAADLARSANTLADQVIEITAANRDTLAGSRTILDDMHNMTSAVDQGTGLVDDVEEAVRNFAACFTKIEILAGKISSTAQNIDMVSLVARVEAARESDMGRNFTVVANEVKQLSEESASHAQEIRQAIVKLTKAANKMSARTRELRNHLARASDNGGGARKHLQEISTILGEETGYATTTREEAMRQKDSMTLIDQHMGALSQGVNSSIAGSAANMELVERVLQLIDRSADSARTPTPASVPANRELSQAGSIIQQVGNNAKTVNEASVNRSDIAEQAMQLAQGAGETAQAGHQRLVDTEQAVDRALTLVEHTLEIVADVDGVNKLLANASGTVDQMREGFSDIEQMAAQIGGISGKTNVLALNASIEASQAGEDGNGFAVVAAEINYLAASAGGFVNEIDQLVLELSTLTVGFNDNINALRQAVEQLASDGLRITEEANELNDILRKTKHERSQILKLLGSQIDAMTELGEKSTALGSDARTAVKGSTRNIELCDSLLDTLRQLNLHHQARAA